MANIKAERFTALKARVKAEMQRRNQSGSVAAYGAAAYDYTEAPATGKIIKQEHRDKLVTPMRAVNSDTVPDASGAGQVRGAELANLETRMSVWEARALTDVSGSDCKAGCTGACYGGCATGCSGCSGCSGCGSGCASTCSGSCSGGCEGGCDGTCWSSCASNCLNSCSAACQNNCETACTDTCYGGCKGGCAGCGGACSNNCVTTCKTLCDKLCQSVCKALTQAGSIIA